LRFSGRSSLFREFGGGLRGERKGQRGAAHDEQRREAEKEPLEPRTQTSSLAGQCADHAHW
jgi:hypothetical protein